jgi:hypothetical protein
LGALRTGLAELKNGMSSEGHADLAAAEAEEPGTAERFASFGMNPEVESREHTVRRSGI